MDHEEGSQDVRPVETVYEFSQNYFLENIAIRSNGGVLVTVHNRNELVYVDPHYPPQQPKPAPAAAVIYRFDAGVSGIVEVKHDQFYVSVGEIGKQGTYGVYRVDMSGFASDSHGNVTSNADVEKIATVPDALFLNGSALLSREKGIILLADSIVGAVFSLDVKSGKVKTWLKDSQLEKVTENPMMPGVNGIKIHNGHLYLSNTDAKTFLRAELLLSNSSSSSSSSSSNNNTTESSEHTTAAAAAAGKVEIVQRKLNADDFAFDEDGSVYLTTHVYESVVKLDAADGKKRSTVAGGLGDIVCAGTTAAAFGRTDRDRTSLYVTTHGGMSYRDQSEVGPARLLRVEVGRAAAA